MKSPLSGRPGLVSEDSTTNQLARELGKLAENNDLIGAVLISFKGDRVGVNSSGRNDEFSQHMQLLGDRILAAIDDGKFDPEDPTPGAT